MKHSYYAMGFYKVILCLLLSFLFSFSHAALRTYYAEDLCLDKDTVKIDLLFDTSGVITAVPNGAIDCRIKLLSERGASLVISFYQYMLDEDDILEFQDSNNFRVSVKGEGTYLDERKSLTLQGPLIIHYATKSNVSSYRQKFNLVFTQVRDSPCFANEFKCQNNKCIEKKYKCDRHNHCGDLSEQKNCSTDIGKRRDGFVEYRDPRLNYITIFIIICSVLAFVIIVLSAVLIRACIVRKKQVIQPPLPAVSVASNFQHPTAPTFFGRIRQSFRSMKNHQNAEPSAPADPENGSENYEVPSMYPRLPSAPAVSGTDNPEFKRDEGTQIEKNTSE